MSIDKKNYVVTIKENGDGSIISLYFEAYEGASPTSAHRSVRIRLRQNVSMDKAEAAARALNAVISDLIIE